MSEVNRRFFDALMADKKLSLRGLAQRMGMGHSQLSLTFSGGRRMTLDEASQLSQIFGVPLHRIVENAGVSIKPNSGRRVQVIGSVKGDGTVDLYPRGTVERTTSPDDMPEDTVAIQCRTSGSPLDWADSMVLFCREPEGVDPAVMGRLSFCKLKDGPAVLATVRRGYLENSHNLSGFYAKESAVLESATPILLIRP